MPARLEGRIHYTLSVKLSHTHVLILTSRSMKLQPILNILYFMSLKMNIICWLCETFILIVERAHRVEQLVTIYAICLCQGSKMFQQISGEAYFNTSSRQLISTLLKKNTYVVQTTNAIIVLRTLSACLN